MPRICVMTSRRWRHSGVRPLGDLSKTALKVAALASDKVRFCGLPTSSGAKLFNNRNSHGTSAAFANPI